ncbi:MAG: lytic transglycosylase domain-containing protein, partial [Pseudomonadota bacterium]
MMNRILYYLCILFGSLCAHGIDYQDYLTLHNSNYCNNYFDHFEAKYQIPKHLLRSISIRETGRWFSKAKIYIPWPWSINQGGKSYYFSTKKEAVEKVRQMLKMGYTNIDIGCMQINLHHHQNAFS